MKLRRITTFVFQAVTAGLAAAIVVVFLRPDLLGNADRPVVEITEQPAPQQSDAGPAAAPAGPVSYRRGVERAAPAVVNVYTAKVVTERTHPFADDPALRRFFGDEFGVPRQRVENSLGSGVIVSEQGYVLTNNHVVESATEIHVALTDGRTARAEKVGSDPESDLAVLKLDLDGLSAITIADSSELAVGDVVLAIGNPFGVGQAVSMGIVSGTGRSHLGISTFENFIQTDAAINPGNSGGALINPRGELVGINTAIFSRTGGFQGIGFAIPANLAKGVMEEIVEHGRVIRGWLGVEIQSVNAELAESFGLDSARGVVIAGVLNGGPADRAGLAPGDIVLRIDGETVTDARSALTLIARHEPGSTLTVEGLREGEAFEKSVEVGTRPTNISRQ